VDPAPEGAAGADDEATAGAEDDAAAAGEATDEDAVAAGAVEAAVDDELPLAHPAAATTTAPAASAPPSRSNIEAEPFITNHPFPGKCQALSTRKPPGSLSPLAALHLLRRSPVDNGWREIMALRNRGESVI
jgi:hypothetical protein